MFDKIKYLSKIKNKRKREAGEQLITAMAFSLQRDTQV